MLFFISITKHIFLYGKIPVFLLAVSTIINSLSGKIQHQNNRIGCSVDTRIIKQKVTQAAEILQELDIDVWLIFVRESHTMPDPAIELAVGTNVTWQSAFIIHRSGDTTAIVGSLEVPNTASAGIYKNVIGYVQSVKEPLLNYFTKTNPAKIAINYSLHSNLADGLTYGMYLSLLNYFEGTPFVNRFISSEDIIAHLQGRKSDAEIAFMQTAIDETLEIYSRTTGFISAGKTEKDIADFIKSEVNNLGRELAWEAEHCPAVYTGPETAGAHSGPTDRIVEKGHIINIDYGTKFNGYCSDLQRTWYVLRDGENSAPPEVQHGFDTIAEAINRAANKLKQGTCGWEIDAEARDYIVSRGYEEYQHGLGHQVGRVVHDGGAGLFPRWERYGNLPFIPITKGQVFTIEPRLLVKGFGVCTIEEMVQVTEDGCRFLSNRQLELWVV